MQKSVAVFGGSFDPPTLGHLMVVCHILLNEPETDVLIVPCFDHVEKHLLPFYHRFEMCDHAFSYLNRVEVSDIETKLVGPSYTSVTIRRLHETNPNWNLRFVLGADLKESAKTWEGWEEIEKYAPPLIVGRAGIPTENTTPPVCPPCSSTMVRQLIEQGDFETVKSFVPRRVLAYIKYHGLYQKN